MKRYAKYLIGLAVIAVVAVLVMVNRNSVQEDIDRASAKQLSVVLDGVEQIYEYSEDDSAYVGFDAQMQQKERRYLRQSLRRYAAEHHSGIDGRRNSGGQRRDCDLCRPV